MVPAVVLEVVGDVAEVVGDSVEVVGGFGGIVIIVVVDEVVGFNDDVVGIDVVVDGGVIVEVLVFSGSFMSWPKTNFKLKRLC